MPMLQDKNITKTQERAAWEVLQVQNSLNQIQLNSYGTIVSLK